MIDIKEFWTASGSNELCWFEKMDEGLVVGLGSNNSIITEPKIEIVESCMKPCGNFVF